MQRLELGLERLFQRTKETNMENIEFKYCLECGTKFVGFGFLCEPCTKQKFEEYYNSEEEEIDTEA